MRAFLAFPLEENLKQKISSFIKEIKSEFNGKVKWVEIENLHLTAKFLGEINDYQKQKIIDILKEISFPSPFPLTITNIGFFPSHFNPKIFWLGFKQDKYFKKIIELIRKINSLAFQVGIPQEKRSPKPHLTLARIKYTKPINLLSLEEKFTASPLFQEKWTLKALNLYESILTPEGPIYKIIEKFPLKQN